MADAATTAVVTAVSLVEATAVDADAKALSSSFFSSHAAVETTASAAKIKRHTFMVAAAACAAAATIYMSEKENT